MLSYIQAQIHKHCYRSDQWPLFDVPRIQVYAPST